MQTENVHLELLVPGVRAGGGRSACLFSFDYLGSSDAWHDSHAIDQSQRTDALGWLLFLENHIPAAAAESGEVALVQDDFGDLPEAAEDSGEVALGGVAVEAVDVHFASLDVSVDLLHEFVFEGLPHVEQHAVDADPRFHHRVHCLFGSECDECECTRPLSGVLDDFQRPDCAEPLCDVNQLIMRCILRQASDEQLVRDHERWVDRHIEYSLMARSTYPRDEYSADVAPTIRL